MLGLRDLFADLALLTYGGLDRMSARMNTAQVKTVDFSILIFPSTTTVTVTTLGYIQLTV